MFSFFLRSKLVTTNFLQFIKFLSRTQSLFFKGENRKLSPGAVRLYYVRSEPGVHIHTPAGRIYRTMQPAAYQRIVTPYMPDSSGSGKSSHKTGHKKSARQTCLADFFCTRGGILDLKRNTAAAPSAVPTNGMANPTAVCKTGAIKVFPFAFNFMCLLFKHTDRPFYAPLPPMCKGTQIKRETANFSAVSLFTYRYACANRLAHTPSPLSQKSKQYTYESVSTQSPGYIASGCGFCTVFSSTILFCRISNTVAP